ncbi:hypothetical protein, partial [Clavibacter michiganensis]|uniref:hypothetical protein n=1 Tax=Clavibacter michiganensis TaxID=28447 RepID=UPI00293020FA
MFIYISYSTTQAPIVILAPSAGSYDVYKRQARHVLLVRGLVEEPEVLAGCLDVVVQVEVGAVRDAHELAPL